MFGNMFSSLYGKPDQGIFDGLFSRYGSSPPIKREDIRLSGYGDDEAEDAETEEAENVAVAATTVGPPVSYSEIPPPYYPPLPTKRDSITDLFYQDIGGFPIWLLGVGFLGFALAYRRKRNKQSSRKR